MREPMHKQASGKKYWLFLFIFFVVIFEGCYYAVRFNNIGIEKYLSGDIEGAIEDYNRAIKIDSNYAPAYYNRGIAFLELGDPFNAVKDFTKAIEINPDYALAYYNRGIIYEELGDSNKALMD